MPSLFTSNGGLELPADGEQDGVWGDTVNANMQIIDRLTNGVGAITLSGTTHTLTTLNGTPSDGHYAVVVFGGTPSGTNTVTVAPNEAEKVYFVRNTTAQSIVLTQGSGGAVTLLAGDGAIIYADGAGTGAAVVDFTGTFAASLTSLGVTATAAELNILDGATVTTSELNILDGVTASTAELNILDGVTATAAELNILDGVTATAAELNLLAGATLVVADVDATAAELNILDGVTATTAELNILDGVTATTAELNILDGVTATAAELNILDGVTATTEELNSLDGVTANVQSQFDGIVTSPAGTVIQFAGASAPTGYLKANGSAVSRTSYAALFAAIGTVYGVGDGSTTFNVPDLRGEFVRGLDDDRGIDAGRALGTAQADAFQGHYHDLTSDNGTLVGIGNTVSIGSGGSSRAVNGPINSDNVRTPITDGTNGTPRIGAETRPRNIALLYCIKT